MEAETTKLILNDLDTLTEEQLKELLKMVVTVIYTRNKMKGESGDSSGKIVYLVTDHLKQLSDYAKTLGLNEKPLPTN